MRKFIVNSLAVIILAGGVFVAVYMIKNRPEVKTKPRQALPPLVRTHTVKKQPYQLTVSTQGTVMASTEIDLVPEVAGKVVYVSPSMESGGFFEKDELLVKINPVDYELAVTAAEAKVAQAETLVARVEAEAQVARDEWKSLGGKEASPLVLHEPQLAEAKATLSAAKASLQQARLNLSRTRILAPFKGRVRMEQVDVGQFIGRGIPIAKLYAVDVVEVRLPLSTDDLAYIELPLTSPKNESYDEQPKVVFTADIAGDKHHWEGRIVRSDGTIDLRSRMLNVIAQVKDPYDTAAHSGKPPMAIGLFVNAEIFGFKVEDVAVIPRSAMRGEQVLVLDNEERLHFRDVKVLYEDRESTVIQSGLENGERVCLSVLESVIEGMKVRTASEEKG